MKFGKKVAVLALGVSAFTLSLTGVASAHVTVKPGEVKTATYQIFTVSVPVEKDQPTVSVKLEIPKGVPSVTPTVKPGWNIEVEKTGTGEEATVKSVTWSGNEIGAGYRDEFTFSAKTPDKATELQWKAYQTYQDGTVVSWDQKPSTEGSKKEGSDKGPFSVTKVLSESAQDTALQHVHDNAHTAQRTADKALYVAFGGIILALIALFYATRKKA